MQSLTKPHLEAVKRILKYINSTSDLGLFFKRKNDLVFIGYTDANFGGDMDNRRSTLGYIFLCGGTGISWCSKKQDSVSLSTTEAEYKATTLTAQECVWLQRLAEKLHLSISKPTTIFGDNQSAIKLANNSVFHARTKHIEVEDHFIREKVLDGTLYTSEVRSQENIADIFTKSLPKASFEFLPSKIGIVSKNHFKGECEKS
ncbi:hypothetical protein MTR67_040914 [Solanum verrucosum]|uniref:Retrovirus-related Pol polyprotein from transposon TNT 1-94 n=1 Tax=Solanum verrucosum TaxID=315347 RepID=A0AAF0UKE9_SOLVR|nr:hypothetical protein MTR67_040914 [Solanum verrucosum]